VAAKTEEVTPTEPETWWRWRFEGLRSLGFSYDAAHELAERADILHKAQPLIDSGCPPEVAERILL
jgi:hypothetical protein